MTDDQRRPSIATIFNPRKQRGSNVHSGGPRPSVVVTDEDTPRAPLQLTNGGESLRISSSPRTSFATSGRSASFNLASLSSHHQDADGGSTDNRDGAKLTGLQRITKCICSVTTRKIFAGIIVTFCVASSWVGATHLLKDIFNMRAPFDKNTSSSVASAGYLRNDKTDNRGKIIFDAPFFATWFCTCWTGLFFPIYLLCHACCRSRKSGSKGAFKTIAQSFRDRGLTFGKFLTRCLLFCILWVGSTYLYFSSLQLMQCTDVMALFSAHIAFVYLLAWVVLHEQFVGVRIVAVIMCNTGIALLAYMDGIMRTQTLLGVVMGGAAAAASAVHKVFFRKVVGDSNYGQVGVFFTFIAFLNALLLSPLVAVLILIGYEQILWDNLPWPNLLLVAALYLVFNLLCFFGLAVTFEVFITLGIILAVLVSGIFDVKFYGIVFEGMKLAGIVLITCGFFLVLFPANWPQYITKILRWGRHRKRHQQRLPPEPKDYRTGLISRSHLRSPSGLIR